MNDKVNTALIKDHYYHIFNRGNNGEKLFYNERNYEYFLEKLSEYLNHYIELYAYCLLPNHFHLLIKVVRAETDLSGFKNLAGLKKPKNISRAFSDFFNSYTKSINIQENRHGSLFSKPFKRKVVTSNEQLLINIVYIHRNPLHHYITDSFQTYKWSSYSDIVNHRNRLIVHNYPVNLFGDIKNFISIHHQAELDYKDISLE